MNTYTIHVLHVHVYHTGIKPAHSKHIHVHVHVHVHVCIMYMYVCMYVCMSTCLGGYTLYRTLNELLPFWCEESTALSLHVTLQTQHTSYRLNNTGHVYLNETISKYKKMNSKLTVLRASLSSVVLDVFSKACRDTIIHVCERLEEDYSGSPLIRTSLGSSPRLAIWIIHVILRCPHFRGTMQLLLCSKALTG
jgi:hypothetical protein